MLEVSQKRSESDAVLAPEACIAEVERLVRSPFLSSSEALCKLLQFLARHTLNSPSEHIKEYEIATEVFGRPPDFDPQADSGVRVQMAGCARNWRNTIKRSEPIIPFKWMCLKVVILSRFGRGQLHPIQNHRKWMRWLLRGDPHRAGHTGRYRSQLQLSFALLQPALS